MPKIIDFVPTTDLFLTSRERHRADAARRAALGLSPISKVSRNSKKSKFRALLNKLTK